MKALTILEETAHRETIGRLLRDDPRLISKHTKRQYRSNLLKFDAWRNDRPLQKALSKNTRRRLKRKAKRPTQ